MDVSLIYYTPDYHKLVEYAARRCYDSFHKCDLNSHRFIRGILKKGHLSVAGHGNMVFGITNLEKSDFCDVLEALTVFKEINNFIRWSRDQRSQWDLIISMNILTYLDIKKELDENNKQLSHFEKVSKGKLFEKITEKIMEIPCLRWFVDDEFEIKESENPYLNGAADLLKPRILVSDYLPLLEKGLTYYELDIHSTVTVEVVTDRSMSFQDARHKDMLGRSEISQRYVTMDNFKYRTPIGVDSQDLYEICGRKMSYDEVMDFIRQAYATIFEYYKVKGLPPLRAKEIARSILTNNVVSRYVDTRPLRQWRHYFELRLDVHAQQEKQQDANALAEVFRGAGIPI